MNPYDYSRGGPDVTLALQKANSKWSRSSVRFASAAPAARDEGSIVEGEYFRDRCERAMPLWLSSCTVWETIPCSPASFWHEAWSAGG